MDRDVIDPYVTKQLAVFRPNTSVSQAINQLTSAQKEWGSLDYIYITEDNRLDGTIPIEKIFAADKQSLLKDVATKEFDSVLLGSDKEDAVILAISKNMYSIPVLDSARHFVGVVEPHNLLKILHEENTEDFLASAGINPKKTLTETLKLRVSQLIRSRLPWLLLGLFGGMIATTIVSFFEKPLEEKIALAFFIPVIVYMSDAVGTQTETLFIRSMAMGQVNAKKYLAKEGLVGLNIGLVIGLMVSLFAFIWLRDIKIAFIIGISMFTNVTLATFIAVLIPLLLFKLKKDPALGSGPFATVIQDILSLLIYFAVAITILTLFE